MCDLCSTTDDDAYDIDCGDLLTGAGPVCTTCYETFDLIRTTLFEAYVYNDGDGAHDYNNYGVYPIHPLEVFRHLKPPEGPLCSSFHEKLHNS